MNTVWRIDWLYCMNAIHLIEGNFTNIAVGTSHLCARFYLFFLKTLNFLVNYVKNMKNNHSKRLTLLFLNLNFLLALESDFKARTFDIEKKASSEVAVSYRKNITKITIEITVSSILMFLDSVSIVFHT